MPNKNRMEIDCSHFDGIAHMILDDRGLVRLRPGLAAVIDSELEVYQLIDTDNENEVVDEIPF